MVHAQPSAKPAAITEEAMLSLPDSPGAVIASSSNHVPDSVATDTYTDTYFDPPPKTTLPMALPRMKFISAGQPAPPQTARDKVLLGLRESVTPFSMIGWVTSAGYSHLTDGRPNYGTNSQAFAQRLGAAAALGTSKEIFSDSIMAPVFHQDPRYYQIGHSRGIVKRGLYAATRSIIGRTDSGRTIPNFALFAGTAGAVVLTKAYYPPRNQSAGEVFQAFGSSLGGSALGYLVSEFGGEIASILHISKHE